MPHINTHALPERTHVTCIAESYTPSEISPQPYTAAEHRRACVKRDLVTACKLAACATAIGLAVFKFIQRWS